MNLIKAVHFSFITVLPMHPSPPLNFNTPPSLPRLKLPRIITLLPFPRHQTDRTSDRARFINSFKPRLLILLPKYHIEFKRSNFIFFALENNVTRVRREIISNFPRQRHGSLSNSRWMEKIGTGLETKIPLSPRRQRKCRGRDSQFFPLLLRLIHFHLLPPRVGFNHGKSIETSGFLEATLRNRPSLRM